jgi:hypothetical protein
VRVVTIGAIPAAVSLVTAEGRPYRGGMHRTALPALLLAALVIPTLATPAPAQQSPPAQTAPSGQTAQGALPHAWLYGEWTGGLFPPPVTLSAQECLASPTVIFTRDAVLRAVPTDVTYVQSLVETVRAVPGGVEFRLASTPQSLPSGGPFGLAPQAQTTDFGCNSQGILHVQRRGEDQISFQSCPEFPYPLVRCPSR